MSPARERSARRAKSTIADFRRQLRASHVSVFGDTGTSPVDVRSGPISRRNFDFDYLPARLNQPRPSTYSPKNGHPTRLSPPSKKNTNPFFSSLHRLGRLNRGAEKTHSRLRQRRQRRRGSSRRLGMGGFPKRRIQARMEPYLPSSSVDVDVSGGNTNRTGSSSEVAVEGSQTEREESRYLEGRREKASKFPFFPTRRETVVANASEKPMNASVSVLRADLASQDLLRRVSLPRFCLSGFPLEKTEPTIGAGLADSFIPCDYRCLSPCFRLPVLVSAVSQFLDAHFLQSSLQILNHICYEVVNTKECWSERWNRDYPNVVLPKELQEISDDADSHQIALCWKRCYLWRFSYGTHRSYRSRAWRATSSLGPKPSNLGRIRVLVSFCLRIPKQFELPQWKSTTFSLSASASDERVVLFRRNGPRLISSWAEIPRETWIEIVLGYGDGNLPIDVPEGSDSVTLEWTPQLMSHSQGGPEIGPVILRRYREVNSTHWCGDVILTEFVLDHQDCLNTEAALQREESCWSSAQQKYVRETDGRRSGPVSVGSGWNSRTYNKTWRFGRVNTSWSRQKCACCFPWVFFGVERKWSMRASAVVWKCADCRCQRVFDGRM